jgi:death-on-curing protein
VSEPIWLERDIVVDIHSEQLALFGGPDGIRDLGLLESALGRPLNKLVYGEAADLAALAAAYTFGIVRNHPFVDGNKRTAAVVSEAFLLLNGYRLDASDAEVVVAVQALAAGELSEAELVAWFREFVREVEG